MPLVEAQLRAWVDQARGGFGWCAVVGFLDKARGPLLDTTYGLCGRSIATGRLSERWSTDADLNRPKRTQAGRATVLGSSTVLRSAESFRKPWVPSMKSFTPSFEPSRGRTDEYPVRGSPPCPDLMRWSGLTFRGASSNSLKGFPHSAQ
ncbi:hypothetical protein Nepgr_005735 [Nepenthes gracilis]|uniref:Uncharacterized protein n=1 Tax=Nepenthes gracilis TaxID=150966 RepID=A0AAD3S3W0_NEPGR|nr:hypothetical protein Nepgr_005735 [Nepenthes gracilis]